MCGLAIWAASLRGVIEMGQIEVREVRFVLVGRRDRRIDDPCGGLNAGKRPPKMMEWEVAKFVFSSSYNPSGRVKHQGDSLPSALCTGAGVQMKSAPLPLL